MTFDRWLRKQKNRDDAIGDIACDYIRDCRYNRVATLSFDFVRWQSFHRQRKEAFDAAIAEYKKLPGATDLNQQ
jgi:hypothetical protein